MGHDRVFGTAEYRDGHIGSNSRLTSSYGVTVGPEVLSEDYGGRKPVTVSVSVEERTCHSSPTRDLVDQSYRGSSWGWLNCLSLEFRGGIVVSSMRCSLDLEDGSRCCRRVGVYVQWTRHHQSNRPKVVSFPWNGEQ